MHPNALAVSEEELQKFAALASDYRDHPATAFAVEMIPVGESRDYYKALVAAFFAVMQMIGDGKNPREIEFDITILAARAAQLHSSQE